MKTTAQRVENMDLRNKLLRRISLFLFMNGCGLFVRSRLSRIIRWILRIIYLLVSLREVYYVYMSFHLTGLSISSISQIQYSVSSFLSYSLIMLRTRDIENFVMDCIESADGKNLNKLLRKATIINMLVATSYVVGNYLTIRWNKPLMTIILKIIVNIQAPWVDITTAFYCIVLQILVVHQKRIIRKMALDLRSVKEGRMITSLMNKRFEKLFSHLPFLWCLNAIIDAPYFAMRISDPKSRGILHEVVFVLQTVTPPITVCMVVSKAEDSIATEIEKCRNRISQCHRITQIEQLRVETELQSIKLQVTGLSFFTLNRSLALSYLGNVITFAALIGTYIKNN